MANDVEDMDTTDNATTLPLPKSGLDSAKNEDKAKLKVSLWSPETIDPKKFKKAITTTLQTWANKNKIKGEFEATTISDDGRKAVITVKPAAALHDLLTLSQKELTAKEKNFKFKINMDQNEPSKIQEESSMGQASSLANIQNGQLRNMSKNDSAADDGNGNSEPLIVALGPYWYMKSVYSDHIQQIEEQNKVKITENVQVTIEGNKKHANPNKAYDEFIELVQSCFKESSNVTTIPLKTIGIEEWKETLKFIQSTNGKCQITISSDNVTISGPYQTAISKSLHRAQTSTNYTDDDRIKTEQERGRRRINSNSLDQETKTSDRGRIRIKMTSEDPFVSDWVAFEDHYWDLIKKQNKKDLDRIQEKFNVTLKDKSSQGKTVVKVHYNKPEGSLSMENHAVRALLRLYQKVTTYNFKDTNGMFDNVEQDIYRSKDVINGASGQTSKDRQADYTKGSTEEGATKEPSGGAAKKDDKEEHNCPVCMDTFKQKTALRCKHEFCKDCLDRSVKSLGAMCPVCKDVFGLVEGDQPDGTMMWYSSTTFLPGFPGCGSIVITYNIPSGKQTEKHPNPGRMYHGLNRTAYLPDNREGNEVLKLLKRAFDQKLIFTVGTSRTTGQDDVVTWNDIHHKTSTYGGQQSFGYPDPDYLSRVKDELKAKGIK